MININSKLAQKFWDKGRLDDCPILDFHAHMFNYIGGYMPSGSPESMLRQMDSSNTILTCFVSHDALAGVDKYRDIEIASKYPERFKNYRVVLSTHLDVDKDLKAIDENRDLHVGFKFLSDYYKIPLSDERHKPFFEYADENRLFVLCHTWGGSQFNGPEHAEKVLQKYHNLIFIAGHSFFGEWDKAVSLVKRYPNLYLEFTAVHQVRGALDYFVQQLGSERILFGTDLPWFSYSNGIGAILSAEMSDDDRRNILYRNGQKLLSRFEWFAPIWDKNTQDEGSLF
jgi:predicted TIM-barrel fold metal-dependent hydrolase